MDKPAGRREKGRFMMAVMAIVCAVLAAGCVTADKLFPRIPAIERFVRGLPLGRGPGR